MDKKKNQLGMNPSVASHRLVKDLLYEYVKLNHNNICFRCGLEMTRETFSIDHKIPWLDSNDPLALFFDLSNISFSHLSCNSADARHPNKGIINIIHGTNYGYDNGCRCELCVNFKSYKNKKRIR